MRRHFCPRPNRRSVFPLKAALGFPIEIIAGREEARLIYLGVAHALPPTRDRRLVVDIGGGSPELIIGKKIEPMLMDSLYMGCVSYSLRFFPGGRVDAKRLTLAYPPFVGQRGMKMIEIHAIFNDDELFIRHGIITAHLFTHHV